MQERVGPVIHAPTSEQTRARVRPELSVEASAWLKGEEETGPLRLPGVLVPGGPGMTRVPLLETVKCFLTNDSITDTEPSPFPHAPQSGPPSVRQGPQLPSQGSVPLRRPAPDVASCSMIAHHVPSAADDRVRGPRHAHRSLSGAEKSKAKGFYDFLVSVTS